MKDRNLVDIPEAFRRAMEEEGWESGEERGGNGPRPPGELQPWWTRRWFWLGGLAILLLIVVLSLWAASLGLLISAISRKEDQVITLSLIAMFVFAAMGGAWFPLEVAGKAFSAIGHVMPTAWAMDGFQNILLRGLAFQSVLMPVGILLAYAVAFFGLAVWRFRFE